LPVNATVLKFKELNYKYKRVLKKLLYKITNWTFKFWEKLGIHITADHFYSPIPNVSNLKDNLWEKSLDVPGVNFNESEQLELISSLSHKYQKEIKKILLKGTESKDYHFDNENFSRVDSEVLYYMIRHFKPSRIIEIGSGFSTLLLMESSSMNIYDNPNYKCRITSIDPFPNDLIKNIKNKDYFEIIPKKIQDMPLSFFNDLNKNDILFIDSSHVIKIGSDVQYEYLEIIPKLNKGVIIHCHDIFMPSEYAKNWIRKEHRFWNEQYILQAFLSFNKEFKVLWAGSYMHLKNPGFLKEKLVTYNSTAWPLSFYLQRVKI